MEGMSQENGLHPLHKRNCEGSRTCHGGAARLNMLFSKDFFHLAKIQEGVFL